MIKKIFFGSIGFLVLLTIIFFILKITGAVNWHWVFVFMPLICLVGFFILFCTMSILILASESDEENRRKEWQKHD